MNSYLIAELTRTRDQLLGMINNVSNEKALQKKTVNEWSIIEVVEHLCLIEQAYMREFFIALNYPQKDEPLNHAIPKYEFPVKMKSKPEFTPMGRFCSKDKALKVFLNDRNLFINQIQNCNIDLKNRLIYRDQEPFQTVYDMVISNTKHNARHNDQIFDLLND